MEHLRQVLELILQARLELANNNPVMADRFLSQVQSQLETIMSQNSVAIRARRG